MYSWGYADGKYGLAPGTTRIVLELQESPTGTLLVLRHEGLPTSQLRENHLQGWTFRCAQLASAAATAQIDAALPQIVAAYIHGWNAADYGARAQALESSVEQDIVYRDRMALVRGRDALIGHIGATRAYAPDLMMELVGRARQSHNYATFDWRITDRSGAVFATGSCYGDVSLDARFRSIVGFWDS